MAFYHAKHALFPDEYIKIITVQTDFLITDLLAIVLCVLSSCFFPLSLPRSLSLSFFMPCLFICTSEYRIVRAMSFPSTWKWFWKCQSCLLYSVITSLFFYRIFNQWGDPWEGKYLIYALFQILARFLPRRYCEMLQGIGGLIILPCFSQIPRRCSGTIDPKLLIQL